MLAWGLYRNLENSLYEFLTDKVTDDSVTDINDVLIPIRVGRKRDNDWTLPCITVYMDNETAERAEIGSNNRLEKYLIIIDIYATNEGERMDLANWLKDTINDGFRYFSIIPSKSDPQNPIKVSGGLVEVNFLTNARVALGQNVDLEDSHRHRISINTWISGT